jgi:hypothetical protein
MNNDIPATEPAAPDDPDQLQFYHGTRTDLRPGDLIEPGHRSNYGTRRQANHVYLTATLDAAVWGARLAAGVGRGRIYLIEPTDPIEDNPNLTDKKFSGNPTKSYRSKEPLRVKGGDHGMAGACTRRAPRRKKTTSNDSARWASRRSTIDLDLMRLALSRL